jgi:hypothetical protein
MATIPPSGDYSYGPPSGSDPGFMPFSKFEHECHMLLEELARNYHKDDRPGIHSDDRARITSRRLATFVFDNWREEYRELNWPQYKRKLFPVYQQGDN